nr:hypothetical protein [Tanacetum cinerariifolium]
MLKKPQHAGRGNQNGNPQQALQDKYIIDSGFLRYMTRNISFLSEFEEINRGYVAFGGDRKGGKIFGKGKIKTGKLDFDDVYFVKELKFNLFSVSQMVPKENNMYNVDLKNVVPSEGLTCIFSKATLDESNLWHMRLGHINFKTMNKHVKGNLFCGMKEIKREFSVARTPQQNGLAKTKNRTLIEAARTMLVDSLLAIPFWAKAVNTACYVQNRKTLHINFLENKPNVAGIGPKWLFDIDTLTMSMNYQPVIVGNQPNDNAGLKENLDAGKVVKEIVSAQQYVLLPLWSYDSQDPKNTNDNVADDAFEVKENENDVHVSAHESARLIKRNMMKRLKEMIKERVMVNAVSEPVDAAGLNPTNSTNSFNTASPFINAISPNFRIARQSSFVDPSKYPDYPDMPELEYIVYSDDEEDVGAKADVSNLETNIPVSPIPITRVHKDHPVNQIIGELNSTPQIRSVTRMVKEQGGQNQINDKDFYTYSPKGKRAIVSKWVFRNKKDERGIVIRNKARLVAQLMFPLWFHGFEDPAYPDKVYKVVKALYGLHQALRAWYLKGKPHLGLWYPRDSLFNLVAYSDSDYVRDSLDRKSTTEGCQFL